MPGAPAKVAGIGKIALLEGGDPAGIGRGDVADLSPEPGEILLPGDASATAGPRATGSRSPSATGPSA